MILQPCTCEAGVVEVAELTRPWATHPQACPDCGETEHPGFVAVPCRECGEPADIDDRGKHVCLQCYREDHPTEART